MATPYGVTEFPRALLSLDQNPNVNVIVLTGAGDHFCSRIDLNDMSSIASQSVSRDRGRDGEKLIRYCSKEAFFSVKEVGLAITADLGTLQSLPSIVGYDHGPRRSWRTAYVLLRRVSGSFQLAVTGTKAVLQMSRECGDADIR